MNTDVIDDKIDQSQRGGGSVGNKNVNMACEWFFLFALCAPVGQRLQHDVEFV